MENAIKTNRLSIVSFVSGLIALLSLGLYWGLLTSHCHRLQDTQQGLPIVPSLPSWI